MSHLLNGEDRKLKNNNYSLIIIILCTNEGSFPQNAGVDCLYLKQDDTALICHRTGIQEQIKLGHEGNESTKKANGTANAVVGKRGKFP